MSTLLPASQALGQFSAADLEGTWHVYDRWDLPSANDAGWDSLFGLAVGPTGNLTGGSLSSSVPFESDLVTGGNLGITSEGAISGVVEFSVRPDVVVDRFQIGPGSTQTPTAVPPSDLFLGAFTDGDGYVHLSAGVRQACCDFEIGDITGGIIWRYFAHYDLSDSGANDPGWVRAQFRFRPTTGNRAEIDDSTGIDSEGEPVSLDGLEVAVQPDGPVALLPIAGGFRLARDKSWMIGISTDPDGYRSFAVLLQPAIGLMQADLEGAWTWYRFADSVLANAPTWARGAVWIDASGNVLGGFKTTSDGSFDRATGGSLILGLDGEIDGSIDYPGAPSDPIAAARLSRGRNLLASVASSGAQRGLTLAVPLPEPALALGLSMGCVLLGMLCRCGDRVRTLRLAATEDAPLPQRGTSPPSIENVAPVTKLDASLAR